MNARKRHPRVHYAGGGNQRVRVVAIVMALSAQGARLYPDGRIVPMHRGNDCRTVIMAGAR